MDKQSEVHFLPCDIDYDGSTDMKAYFKITEGSNGKLTSQLRGHEMQGEAMAISKDGLPVQGILATKGVQMHTDQGTKLEITGRFDSITVWQHDTKPDIHQIQDYVEWFEISHAVHG